MIMSAMREGRGGGYHGDEGAKGLVWMPRRWCFCCQKKKRRERPTIQVLEHDVDDAALAHRAGLEAAEACMNRGAGWG